MASTAELQRRKDVVQRILEMRKTNGLEEVSFDELYERLYPTLKWGDR